MELLASIAVIAGGTLALFIALVGVVALFLEDEAERPLLLALVLRQQGRAEGRLAVESGSRDFAVAVQRCLACNETAQCRAWLASGAHEGYQAFCPNAGYVERVKKLAA